MAARIQFEEALLAANRDYIASLEKGLEILEKEIEDARDVEKVCTDEWCKSVDVYIDELHNAIYSLTEPRFGSEEDSRKIKELRRRIRDLYVQFKEVTGSGLKKAA